MHTGSQACQGQAAQARGVRCTQAHRGRPCRACCSSGRAGAPRVCLWPAAAGQQQQAHQTGSRCVGVSGNKLINRTSSSKSTTNRFQLFDREHWQAHRSGQLSHVLVMGSGSADVSAVASPLNRLAIECPSNRLKAGTPRVCSRPAATGQGQQAHQTECGNIKAALQVLRPRCIRPGATFLRTCDWSLRTHPSAEHSSEKLASASAFIPLCCLSLCTHPFATPGSTSRISPAHLAQVSSYALAIGSGWRVCAAGRHTRLHHSSTNVAYMFGLCARVQQGTIHSSTSSWGSSGWLSPYLFTLQGQKQEQSVLSDSWEYQHTAHAPEMACVLGSTQQSRIQSRSTRLGDVIGTRLGGCVALQPSRLHRPSIPMNCTSLLANAIASSSGHKHLTNVDAANTMSVDAASRCACLHAAAHLPCRQPCSMPGTAIYPYTLSASKCSPL
eukprot:1159634-Pelagomonas_calceolata.AAC.8